MESKLRIGKKKVILIALLAASMLLTVFAFAADGSYDSASDPLISKSYLDKRIDELNASILGEIEDASNEIAALREENAALKETLGKLEEKLAMIGGTPSEFVPVELTTGQTIYPNGGSIEIVIRTGGGKVVSPDDQPISDITVGKELPAGESVSLSHYIIIPRDDGRGIKITGKSTWVMVRGNYEIK